MNLITFFRLLGRSRPTTPTQRSSVPLRLSCRDIDAVPPVTELATMAIVGQHVVLQFPRGSVRESASERVVIGILRLPATHCDVRCFSTNGEDVDKAKLVLATETTKLGRQTRPTIAQQMAAKPNLFLPSHDQSAVRHIASQLLVFFGDAAQSQES